MSTARLFARDFQIAVLDEPSSALDPVAEYKMYENLLQVTENKTVIFISHRLSSAVLSDRILVLDGGKITEDGTYDELIAQNGVFAEEATKILLATQDDASQLVRQSPEWISRKNAFFSEIENIALDD